MSWIRAGLSLVLGFALTSNVFGCGYRRPPLAPVARTPVAIHAAPVALDPHDPGRTAVGALRWAGVLVLTAPGARSLGGLSGLDVADDGVSFVSQSDEGALLRGRLVLDGAGRLAGVADASLQRLVDEAGRPYGAKIEADAEDVTLIPGGYAISFEQRHRVLAYGDGGGPGRPAPISPAMALRGHNTGLEALSWRAGAYYEGAEDGEVWRCRPGRPAPCASVMPSSPFPGYALTGLDGCGAGFVAVYRRVDALHGWRALVAELTPARADGAGPWRARALAVLERPLTRDNMEGISCTARPGGAPGRRLYLVSDDNFESFQRTLLLAFDWPGGG